MRIGERKSSWAWVLLRTPQYSRKSTPAAGNHEEWVMHEAKLSKVEAEMKMVFQQKVAGKESKLKQSEEELHARHKEVKKALDKQKDDLE